MSLKDFGKKLHDTFVEDDGATAAKPAPVPTKAPTSNFNFGTTAATGFPPPSTVPSPASPFAVPGTVVLDEAVYQRVFKLTDFDQTDVGKAVHKYYDALEGTGLDPNTRFKSALKQAGAIDGITADRVLATFDQLLSTLAAEGDKFGKIVEAQTQKEVVARQQHQQQISDQIAQLTQQIADLQAQHTQLSAELVDAQGKISNAQTQFGLASSRRSNEINQQKAQFAALLK